MAWISKETLADIPDLPKRVDWEKDRGMVNLLPPGKKTKAWLPAGFYKAPKGGARERRSLLAKRNARESAAQDERSMAGTRLCSVRGSVAAVSKGCTKPMNTC